MKILIIAIFSIAGAIACAPARAQQDYIIAGDHLARLWDAIDAQKVKIANSELRRQILDRSLSAILLPKGQAGSLRKVRRCFQDKSVFDEPDLEISASDFEQLTSYSKDLVYALVFRVRKASRTGNHAELQDASKQLRSQLESLPKDQREASVRFAGSLLADIEPVPQDLAEYVEDFKSFTEKRTLKTIWALHDQFLAGRVYVVGSEPFTVVDFGKIDPAKVKYFEVSGVEFRKVWVGSTFLVTPQSKSAFVLKDPTGLGLDPGLLSAGNSSSGLLRLDVTAPEKPMG